jgi:hypothetical protein
MRINWVLLKLEQMHILEKAKPKVEERRLKLPEFVIYLAALVKLVWCMACMALEAVVELLDRVVVTVHPLEMIDFHWAEITHINPELLIGQTIFNR